MGLPVLSLVVTAILWCGPAAPEGRQQLTSGPKDVTLDNGTVVRVEAGELEVPESRRRPMAEIRSKTPVQ